MTSQIAPASAMALVGCFEDHVHTGMSVLFRAYTYALHAGTNRWNIAVPIVELYESGMTQSDFHWLLACRFAEHAREITPRDADSRQFVREGRAVFHDDTCFVLTPRGAEFAADLLRLQLPPSDALEKQAPLPIKASEAETRSKPIAATLHESKPLWDARQRELRVGGVLVKRFRVNAGNQETILSVFQEEGWPERIDDPLPPSPDITPKRRLHDTIVGLNRNQVNRLIRFYGNGCGNGICWEFIIAVQR